MLAYVPQSVSSSFNWSEDLPIDQEAVIAGDIMYFTAWKSHVGMELWRTDGTGGGTTRVQGAPPGNPLYRGPEMLTSVGNTVFFTGDINSTGRELWKTNGTPEGTAMVRDIYPGRNASIIWSMVSFKGELYFTAFDGMSHSLWTSDGTEAGTKIVHTLPSAAQELNVVGDSLYFRVGSQIWKSDGTNEGTALVTFANSPNGLFAFNGVLYFQAQRGHGRDLMRCDGTVAGTQFVSDFWQVPWRSNVYLYRVVGNSLYLSATDAAHGNELWKSDGTADGTTLLKDVMPGSGGSNPWAFGSANDTVYFWADDGTRGRALWKSDGTEATTVYVKKLFPDSTSDSSWSTASLGNTLFFSAKGPGVGVELWQSDGTESGTFMTADFAGGEREGFPNSSYPGTFIHYKGTLFFFASTDNASRTLYKLVYMQAGDADYDGDVDLEDLNIVRNYFGISGTIPGDLDGNNRVDVEDLNLVRNNFGAHAPSPITTRTPTRSAANTPSIAATPSTTISSSESAHEWRDVLFGKEDVPSEGGAVRRANSARRTRAFELVFALA